MSTQLFSPALRPLKIASAVVAAALAWLAIPAIAADESRTGVYVQAGENMVHERDTTTLHAGVMLPRDRGGEAEASVTSYWDIFYGQWHGRQANGSTRSFNQIGAAVMWRKRFDAGVSAWFAEGGLGVSYLDGDYSVPDGRVFGSRVNFTTRVGIGRSFGSRDAHELSLNYQHFSNGGIRKPNPGADLLQLRYAYRF